ncbi:hypothetical protein KY313_02240 [Candidatus Woesearchaeota archaeon]|nr:hypothetical protein [Candidatus Woesearchaeota archaeon]
MVKNLKNKKGIFFTALLVLMASTLLTLSVLLFYNTLESEKRFVELASLDTVHNLYGSVENSIIKIVQGITMRNYISVDYSEEYIEFNWNLNDTEIIDISLKLDEFEEFVTDKYHFINIDNNLMSSSVIGIEVDPPGIDVRREWGIKII